MIAALIFWGRLGGGLVLAVFFANFFEFLVHDYTLPDPLISNEGFSIQTVEEWEEIRRPELLALFSQNVYGPIPEEKPEMSIEVLEEGKAFDDIADRKQVRLTLERNGISLPLQLLIYTPTSNTQNVQIPGFEQVNVRNPGFAQEREKVPVVVSYNYEGNHTVSNDLKILPSVVYAKRLPNVLKKFDEKDRGKQSERFPVEDLLRAGYATVSVYYGDVDPDFDDGFKNGAHALYPEFAAGTWGSISAWAWGYSRIIDYIEAHESFNIDREFIFGFSRLGKAALWAAAQDTRIDTVIVDSPGEGGAALARRNYGENIFLMTFRFPHWFIPTYSSYAGKEDKLPIDQHELIALIAPRPLLVSSSNRDFWSDFNGEYFGLLEADPVYDLYSDVEPTYVLHQGPHEVTKKEWEDYISFLNLTR